MLASYDTPEWQPSKAQDWVAGQITQFGEEITGVVAANDGTAGGAIAALKAAGDEPRQQDAQDQQHHDQFQQREAAGRLAR